LSILSEHIARRQKILRQFRQFYLRGVAAEMGMPNSLAFVALREAQELIELASETMAADATRAAAKVKARR
jgi:hypothetical protein